MFQLIAFVQAFIASKLGNERGATAVEYGLLVALIAMVMVAAVTTVGTDLKTLFENVAAKI
jgi:pilus assembly protein Flp/PilA